jgi:translation elongation factor EF-G
MLENIVKILLIALAGGASATFGLYKFYFKKRLEGDIKTRVEKEIEGHKLQLNHEYNKEMADYNLYAGKKHLVYAETSKSILEADSSIRNLFGFRRSPDLNEFNTEDIERYLNNWNLRSGKKEDFIKRWSILDSGKQKKKLIDEINGYLRKIEPQISRNILQEAKNYFFLNIVYFSDELENLIKDIFRDLSRLEAIYDAIIEYPPSSVDKKEREEAENLKTTIDEKISEMIKKMKEELSNNHKKES